MNLEFKLRKISLLYGLLLFFILLRVWFLAVINHEKMQKLSNLPRRKSLSIAPTRGLITDAFATPLACNKRRFDIAIYYKEIKEIPQNEIYFENGLKLKFPKRKTYIQDLAGMLSDYTNLSQEEIEDFIYAKAALFQDTPLTLAENISEQAYHTLKIAEKDWPGLKINITQTRTYPQQKVGCHVIGYLGALDQATYRKALEEKKLLKNYIEQREQGYTPQLPPGFQTPYDVRTRYQELCQKSYNLIDLVGIDGIEKSFDHKLRGSFGRKVYETTRLGHILAELPGSYDKKKPASLQLTLDVALQEKAEQLLAERESTDELFPKGGGCVVLDIKSSKVLALASYPRFDPQDFASKNNPLIHKWTESELYIKKLYQGLELIEKEKYSPKKGFFTSSQRLDYNTFLSTLLSDKSSCLNKIKKCPSVKEAYLIIDSFEKLHEKYGFMDPELLLKELLEKPLQDEESASLFEPIRHHFIDLKDPLLFLDLLKLQIDTKRIRPAAQDVLSQISLDQFFFLSQELAQSLALLEKALEKPFKEHLFSNWRKEHFKTFLKEKREEETLKKTYARPYTEYLDQERKRQFRTFFQRYKSYFLAYLFQKIPQLDPKLVYFEEALSQISRLLPTLSWQETTRSLTLEQTAALIAAIRPFQELTKPLYGSYPRLLDKKHHLEKDLALAFYPKYKVGYLRSCAYRTLAPQGSVFKIAVAYQALKEKAEGKIKKLPIIQDALNPHLRHTKEQILGYDEQKQPIRRWHKGGLLPRSSHSGIGTVDLVSALEQSSNIYFSLLASEYIDDPEELIHVAKQMGLSEKTGIDLPFEGRGKLPQDLALNKSGLYAFAIGQHELLVTPLQTAEMIASLFRHGHVFKPLIVDSIQEETPSSEDLFNRPCQSAYSAPLAHLGCFFPLFTETIKTPSDLQNAPTQSYLTHQYPLTDEILAPIRQGLDRVLWGEKGTARPQAVASLLTPQEMSAYMSLKHKMIGKTGTAEQTVIDTLDQEASRRMLNHIWFAAISFKDSLQKEPELAICIYLKDGKLGGKEAAPIAAKLIQFYQEKKTK